MSPHLLHVFAMSYRSSLPLITVLLRLVIGTVALFCIILLALPIGFYGMAMYFEPSLPKMSELKAMPLEMPLQIYTKDDKLIGQYGNTYSMPITYEQIPSTLINAFLAAEDDSFFEHSGISVKGLGRAITQMVSDSDQQTGGSTITQQVAKNYFLSPEQTFQRKLTEMFLARQIENELSKKEILTLYVNKIYLGQGAYGIKAGARRYYNKELHELSLAQMAMLAGLPKAPSEFNPVANPKRALQRRDWILGRMLAQGYISQADYNSAIAEDPSLQMYQETLDLDLPYLSEAARATLVGRYGNAVMNSGWRVKLTVDSKDQLAAETALKNGLYAYDARHGFSGGIEAESGSLKGRHTVEGLLAAQVTKVKKNGGFEALLADGNTISVAPSRAKVAEGNIVRVKQQGNSWQLVALPKVQGALVALDPRDGALIAMAGGFSFYQNKFNRATQGYRQPGSVIKPLIYAAALENTDLTPDSVLSDSPLRIGNWTPKNADGGFRGGITMKQALAVSRNIPVIRAYLQTGREPTHAMLTSFGLEQRNLPNTAVVALGAAEATPLQIATAYATFMNGGHRIQPYFIDTVYNFDNQAIYNANPAQACAECFNKALDDTNTKLAKDFEKSGATLALQDQNDDTDSTKAPVGIYRLNPKAPKQYISAEQAPRIMTPANTYAMAQMLRGVITSGTGRRANAVGRNDIGGKTGTTNEAKDAWFAGIQPTMVGIAWVGFDDPKPLGHGEYGRVAALPIWVEFAKAHLEGKPEQWVSEGNAAKTKKQKQAVIEITDDTPIDSPESANLAQEEDIPEGAGA